MRSIDDFVLYPLEKEYEHLQKVANSCFTLAHQAYNNAKRHIECAVVYLSSPLLETDDVLIFYSDSDGKRELLTICGSEEMKPFSNCVVPALAFNYEHHFRNPYQHAWYEKPFVEKAATQVKLGSQHLRAVREEARDADRRRELRIKQLDNPDATQ